MLEQGKSHAGNSSLIDLLELFENPWPMLFRTFEGRA
jgi:hypothetical protein